MGERCEHCPVANPDEEIENRFTYYNDGKLTTEQIDKVNEIADQVKALAYYLKQEIPFSREQSIALTYLDSALQFAVAGVTRNKVGRRKI